MSSSETLINALITSSITGGIYAVYKVIQHYRLRSSCNQENQLVVEVVGLCDHKGVDIDKKVEESKSVEVEVKQHS